MLMLMPLACLGADLMTDGLDPGQVYARLNAAQPLLVVDLRKPWEFAIAHIPGAVNIPVTELEDHLQELRGANGVLIYCMNGSRTREAEPVLLNAGITHVYHLNGTFSAWIRSGLGVEKGASGNPPGG